MDNHYKLEMLINGHLLACCARLTSLLPELAHGPVALLGSDWVAKNFAPHIHCPVVLEPFAP